MSEIRSKWFGNFPRRYGAELARFVTIMKVKGNINRGRPKKDG